MVEIASILSLIDRLIDLVKKRSELNREMFNDFVQPAYQAFEVVHADYIDSLTRYKSRLEDTSFELDLNHPVFRDIELDSLKSEHLRTKLADFIPANASKKLQPFLTSIDFYLRGISVSGERAEFIDTMAMSKPPNIDEKQMEQNIGSILVSRDSSKPDYTDILDPNYPDKYQLLFSDPMRVALREALFFYDAPPEDKPGVFTAALEVFGESEEYRRRMCRDAVNGSLRHFQNLYRSVSYEYSKLRSQLIKPA
jgi:hypothetical protein